MGCPLRHLVVIFSTALLLYVALSSYWKARTAEEDSTPAARQVTPMSSNMFQYGNRVR